MSKIQRAALARDIKEELETMLGVLSEKGKGAKGRLEVPKGRNVGGREDTSERVIILFCSTVFRADLTQISSTERRVVKSVLKDSSVVLVTTKLVDAYYKSVVVIIDAVAHAIGPCTTVSPPLCTSLTTRRLSELLPTIAFQTCSRPASFAFLL